MLYESLLYRFVTPSCRALWWICSDSPRVLFSTLRIRSFYPLNGQCPSVLYFGFQATQMQRILRTMASRNTEANVFLMGGKFCNARICYHHAAEQCQPHKFSPGSMGVPDICSGFFRNWSDIRCLKPSLGKTIFAANSRKSSSGDCDIQGITAFSWIAGRLSISLMD